MDNLTGITGYFMPLAISDNMDNVGAGTAQQAQPFHSEKKIMLSTLSERKVALPPPTDIAFKSLGFYQQQASNAVVDLKEKLGSREGVPVFVEPDRSMEEIYRELKGQPLSKSAKGSRILELANAILELLSIIKGKGMLDKGILDNEKDIASFEELICKAVDEGLKDNNCVEVDGWLEVVFEKIFNAFNVKRMKFADTIRIILEKNGSFGELTHESFYKLHLAVVKFISRLLVGNHTLQSDRFYMDLILFRDAAGDIFLPLCFNPEQFKRLIEFDKQSISFARKMLDKPGSLKKGSILNIFNNCCWDQQKVDYILGVNNVFQEIPLLSYFKHCVSEAVGDVVFRSEALDIASPSIVRPASIDVGKNQICTAIVPSQKSLEMTERTETCSEIERGCSGKLMTYITPYKHDDRKRFHSYLTGKDGAVSANGGELPESQQSPLNGHPDVAYPPQKVAKTEPATITTNIAGNDLQVLLPETIQKKNRTPAKNEKLPAIPSLPPGARLTINKNKMLIGEEFEFWPDDLHSKISREKLMALFEKWRKEASTLFSKEKVGNTQIKRVDRVLSFGVGSWEGKLFKDFDAFEINTTPYSVDETFRLKINGHNECWSAYKLFDHYIHPVANTLGLIGRSGHKHLDIMHSLNGNSELLFRIIVDMENNPWLPKALGRLDRLNNFSYASQDESKQEVLDAMITGVNRRLASDRCQPCYGAFANMLKLREFMGLCDLNDKNSACAIHHLKDAEHTADINKTPTSTIEFRQFHCPRDGHESRLINELLIARIEYLLECQKQRKPIPYEPVNPQLYKEGKDREVVTSFVRYVRDECGLAPSKFKPLLRIEVPEACLPPFEQTV